MDFQFFERLRPLSEFDSAEWGDGYAHMNSKGVSDGVWPHNGDAHSDKNSEIVLFDSDWIEKDCRPLVGQGCHDPAFSMRERF